MRHSQLAALDFFDTVNDTYGQDPDAPPPVDNEVAVAVPEIVCPVREAELARLRQSVDPLAASEDYGLDLYEQVLQLIAS